MEMEQGVRLIPELPPLSQNVGEVRRGGEWEGDVREGEVKEEGVREKEEVGTFFGLPVKVQALLEEHRGIHSLYGRATLCDIIIHV